MIHSTFVVHASKTWFVAFFFFYWWLLKPLNRRSEDHFLLVYPRSNQMLVPYPCPFGLSLACALNVRPKWKSFYLNPLQPSSVMFFFFVWSQHNKSGHIITLSCTNGSSEERLPQATLPYQTPSTQSRCSQLPYLTPSTQSKCSHFFAHQAISGDVVIKRMYASINATSLWMSHTSIDYEPTAFGSPKHLSSPACTGSAAFH